jgi:succinoglycan biosynthesis protein ExoM
MMEVSLKEHESIAPADDIPASVAVCIPTFKRPQYLAQLLESLTALHLANLSLHVLVVDNDAAGSAEAVVQRFAPRLPCVFYEIEPERGIAAARNRLVAMATRLGVEYLAFVDDDEWVEPWWLWHLVHTAKDFQADGVAGVVLPLYDADVPSWIAAGRFFDWQQRRTTGHQLRGSYSTANLLLKRDRLDGIEGPFHRAFDLTGGSDYHLSQCLLRSGARVVWCDEAVVHEHIPASRGNARWLLRRAFRSGVTVAQSARMLDPGPYRAIQAARSLAEIIGGMVLLPRSAVRGKAATLHTLRGCAMRLGTLVGAGGFRYQEYRQTHGQ